MEIGETLELSSATEFADWLRRHGQSAKSIWPVLYKKSSGKQQVTYEELVAVALCYGWIDGQMKSIDNEKYAQRFSPRRPGSKWSTTNRALAKALLATGRMEQAGYDVLPDDLRVTIGKRP